MGPPLNNLEANHLSTKIKATKTGGQNTNPLCEQKAGPLAAAKLHSWASSVAKDRAVLCGPIVAYRRKADQRRSQRGGQGAQAPYQPSCPRNCIGVKRKEEDRGERRKKKREEVEGKPPRCWGWLRH